MSCQEQQLVGSSSSSCRNKKKSNTKHKIIALAKFLKPLYSHLAECFSLAHILSQPDIVQQHLGGRTALYCRRPPAKPVSICLDLLGSESMLQRQKQIRELQVKGHPLWESEMNKHRVNDSNNCILQQIDYREQGEEVSSSHHEASPKYK